VIKNFSEDILYLEFIKIICQLGKWDMGCTI